MVSNSRAGETAAESIVEPAVSFLPEFKLVFRVEVAPPDRVYLLSERGDSQLSGFAYAAVAPLLDGTRTVTEIVEQLEGTVGPLDVFRALDQLLQAGYIDDATTPLNRQDLTFWDSLDTARHLIAKNLESNSVSIHTFGDIDTKALEELLESLGIRQCHDASHQLVLTDDYRRDELLEWQQIVPTAGRPWLLCKPVGTELLFGPLFVPGQTGCIECLRHRLLGHRPQAPGDPAPPLVTWPSTQMTAYSIIGTEVAKWLAENRNDHLEDRVISIDTRSLVQGSHRLVHRPQCPKCGDPGLVAERQWQAIRRERLAPVRSGTIGVAEEAYRRLAHNVSKVTGIVRSISSLTRDRQELAGVFSTAADHIFCDRFDNRYSPTNHGRARSGGKGRSEAEARLSALCESIERYSGIFQGDEARVRASAAELGDACIHPNQCMLFSERQFFERQQINKNASCTTWVPEPFDETVRIEWSPVWSLLGGEQRFIPTAFCYYDYSGRPDIARASSNGCAAGGSLEDALRSASLELIERDSVAIWWYNRLSMPGVDLGSFSDPYFDWMLAYYEDIGRDLWVLDITSDLSIPTFAAVSRRNDRHPEDIILGFGASPDSRTAIGRALVELNQSLPAVHPNSPTESDSSRFVGADRLEWWKTADIDGQAYLAPSAAVRPRTGSDYESRLQRNPSDQLDGVLALLNDQGLNLFALDQTRPDIGLPVARVIIPGLRPFWPRFAAGRLYDVPVKMGWLSEPLGEDDLNPHAIYF